MWTINRGSEEGSITASGTHYRSGYHKVFDLTGTTGALEGGKMQVYLTIDYVTTWGGLAMEGYFDSEENSLKGTLTFSDDTPGEFVFKRHPDFIRLYPAPSTIDARTRWKFATTVILDRIRRQSWSPSYILKRIEGGKRYMDLSLRFEYYGKKLEGDELDEYHGLVSSLYDTDARFYASLINIKLSKVPIQCVDDYSEFLIGTHHVNTAVSPVIPVALASGERESFAWTAMTRQPWTSARNPSASIPWSHSRIGRTLKLGTRRATTC